MKTQDIWQQYHNDLKQFIISKVKEEALADDILQDTFIKIHTKLHTLQDSEKTKAWVFTIARNSTFNYFKQSKLDLPFPEIEAESTEQFEEHTEKDCLYGIINSLPEKYRIPIFLADIRGLKQTEVAQQLDLSLPTTKSRIQRARKLIAQGYMNCCDYKMNEKGYLVGELKEKEYCKVCR